MKIFISSTYEDLKEHRRAVRDVILQLGHQPVAMEYFGAKPTDPQTAALGEIERCGAFVGIYAHRYGWVPDGDTRSITEQEFDFARAHNIPCFCYRVTKDFPWDDELKETGAQAEGLARFLAKIDSQLLRAEFTTPEDLAAKVAADLGRGLAEPHSPKTREERNRRAMLELVENTWIKGVLEKSLYHEMLIQIGMEERPNAVGHPWDMVVQMPDRPNHPLPPGTKIIDVFDELGCTLLILGDPGSGKTTMLLELARDAIARAEQDSTQPIPVVFNLSSWSNPRQPIAEWIMTELMTKYYVPKKLATAWSEKNELLLLLDGLDEVKVERREACVKALNNYRQAHGMTQVVVCSRHADYEALTTKLNLQGAVLLKPLTRPQIEKYLEAAGMKFDELRSALPSDIALRELAQSPLMLSIMMLAYQGMLRDDLSGNQSDSIETRRKHIFATYIQRMFERVGRTHNEVYSKEQTMHWLSWLAARMTEHGQTVFLLERMQLTWLQTRSEETLHRRGVILSVGLVLYLGGLSIGATAGLIPGSVFALIFGLFGVLVERLSYKMRIFHQLNEPEAPVEILKLKWSWQNARLGLRSGLSEKRRPVVFVGLAVGLSVGLEPILKRHPIDDESISEVPQSFPVFSLVFPAST